MSAIHAIEVAKMFDMKVETVVSKNTTRFRDAHVGNGLFDYNKVKAILEEEEYKDWFLKQVFLFVEYLNKIEGITYQEIANKTGMSLQVIYILKFGYETAIKILVKFRKYTYDFDKYYGYIKDV